MIVTIGENVVDIFKQEDGLLRPVPGGSPLNIAVTLARLGVEASYGMVFSDDALGSDMLAHLRANKVGYLPGAQVARPSSLAMVAVAADGQPAYSFYRKGCADVDLQPGDLPALPPEVVHVQVGGSPLIGEDHCGDMLLEWVERIAPDVSLSLDPNVRPSLIADHGRFVARCEKLHRRCKIVRLSDEDATYMYASADPARITSHLLEQGVELAILTLGDRGVYIATPRCRFELAAADAGKVRDTVGAGDCFLGALLALLHERGLLGTSELATLDEARLRELGIFACACSALNCTQVGCNPPAREEVDALAARLAAS